MKKNYLLADGCSDQIAKELCDYHNLTKDYVIIVRPVGHDFETDYETLCQKGIYVFYTDSEITTDTCIERLGHIRTTGDVIKVLSDDIANSRIKVNEQDIVLSIAEFQRDLQIYQNIKLDEEV